MLSATGPHRATVFGLRIAFLGALLALVALKLFSSLDDISYVSGFDEGYYLRYTQAVVAQGFAGFRTNFDQYLGDSSQWMYPNPFRVGFYGAAALWSGSGGATFEDLSALSAASHLALIVLVYVCSLRHFGNGKAELIAIAIGFSPLLLGLGQRALIDSFATLTSALALWSFVNAVQSSDAASSGTRGPIARWFTFGLTFAFAILVKETTVLLFLPLAIYAWIDRRRSAAAFLPLIAAPAVCGLIWILAAGGVGPVIELIDIIVASPETNRYAQRLGSGPWYRYVVDFLLMSPWPVLLCVAAIGCAATRARNLDVEPVVAIFALVIVALIAEYALFTKNLRYVAILDLPMRALAVHFLFDLVRLRRYGATLAVCTLLVVLNAWFDAQTFDGIFVEHKVYDPVSRTLLRFREFIPR